MYFSSVLSGYLVKVDTNFKLIDTVIYNPTFFTQYTRDTGLDFGGQLNLEVGLGKLLIGSHFAFSFISDRTWGALRFNMASRNIERFGTFPIFKDYYNMNFHSFAYSNAALSKNSAYVVGFTTGSLFKNNIVVCAYDTNVNTKWIKRIGDSLHNFRPQNIRICKDGSVMICAYSDSASSPSDFASRDESIYVIRLNPNTGEALSIRNISEQLRSGIAIYPNPARDVLHIKGAAIGSQIVLYNMLGQAIQSNIISNNEQQISISSLPIGTYSYHINDRSSTLSSSGTFIKQ